VDRIPILQMSSFLLVTIQVDMHDELAMTLQSDLTSKITQTGAKAVLIDISGLDMVELGLTLAGVRTALNVEKGMNMLRKSLGETDSELGYDHPEE